MYIAFVGRGVEEGLEEGLEGSDIQLVRGALGVPGRGGRVLTPRPGLGH